LIDESAFHVEIERIERSLALQQIAMPWRPILAHFRFQDLVGHELPYPPSDRDPDPEMYDGDALSTRIHRWYRRRYGSQLDEHTGPGRVAFSMHGGRCAMRLPGFNFPTRLGVYCGPLNLQTIAEPGADHEETIDVLETIENAPQGLGDSLSESQRQSLVQLFVLAYEALELCYAHSDNALIQHSLADNDTCVHQLVSRPPTYGAAKWSALQCAEKGLKGFIQLRGGTFSRTHLLQNLLPIAVPLGMPNEVSRFFGAVQCDPGIRY
jgi:hypothetical protein